jgi:hypothetical protein
MHPGRQLFDELLQLLFVLTSNREWLAVKLSPFGHDIDKRTTAENGSSNQLCRTLTMTSSVVTPV